MKAGHLLVTLCLAGVAVGATAPAPVQAAPRPPGGEAPCGTQSDDYDGAVYYSSNFYVTLNSDHSLTLPGSDVFRGAWNVAGQALSLKIVGGALYTSTFRGCENGSTKPGFIAFKVSDNTEATAVRMN
ncbi:hypothetical protein [Streptacidiphilus anmyonensis]|uniref:hypothetical protein n=1 Tax=Streptacidiphilus anmyonensis TaxID=405782 RepID=UPI0005A81BAA|nr:hypothetical protein [Streptacidiphilus anmyonensis]